MAPADNALSRTKILVWISVTVVAALLLVSPDSYLHDLFNRVDSAWFYICGKAWMNGMTPYVDFTDSKGPLLWLIYGAGYLMSPTNYTGVFWLTCLSYIVTLWFIYRTARLLLGSDRWALLCALLMLLAYFYPYIHEETKTEDFAQPLIAFCLYSCTQLAIMHSLPRRRIVAILIGIGFSMGCVLMMKYSFVPMLGIFALYAIVTARRHETGILASVGWIAVGTAAALLPWAVYFVVAGNFSAFVQEYFVNTLTTLKHLRSEHGTIIDILLKFKHHRVVTLFPLLCLGGAVWHGFKFRRFRLFPVVATCWFFLCTVPNAWWLYYYNTCTWTLFFGIAALLATLKDRSNRQPGILATAATAVMVVAATGAWSVAIVPHNFFACDHQGRDTYYRYAYLMQQVENPTVIYWDCYSTGFETAAHGLPACRYWAGQNGATPQMQQEQEATVRDGRPDFVMVADTTHQAQLAQWGYHKWDYNRRDNIDRCDDLLYTLYTRHTLTPPPEPFLVPSPQEIVLKHWQHGAQAAPGAQNAAVVK